MLLAKFQANKRNCRIQILIGNRRVKEIKIFFFTSKKWINEIFNSPWNYLQSKSMHLSKVFFSFQRVIKSWWLLMKTKLIVLLVNVFLDDKWIGKISLNFFTLLHHSFYIPYLLSLLSLSSLLSSTKRTQYSLRLEFFSLNFSILNIFFNSSNIWLFELER